jgi:hypothetical protein
VELAGISHEDQRLIVQDLLDSPTITKNDVRLKTKSVTSTPPKELEEPGGSEEMPVAAESEMAFQMVLREALASVRAWKGPIAPDTKQLLLDLNVDVLAILNEV